MPRGIALALASLLCCACAAEDPGAADDFHVRLYIAPRTALGGWAADSGSFIIRVSPQLAPLGAARFRELVGSKFYDGAPFFRVIAGFMAQFGINGDPQTQVRSFVSLGTREKGSIVPRVVRRRRAPSRCFIIFSPF